MAKPNSRHRLGDCRRIHDLVLTRSSSGRLARLLLSHSLTLQVEAAETRVLAPMTHEEMAQRIGCLENHNSSVVGEEKKHLIRLDGPMLVICGPHGVGSFGSLAEPFPEDGHCAPPPVLLQHCRRFLTGDRSDVLMYSGRLINDLFAMVERAKRTGR